MQWLIIAHSEENSPVRVRSSSDIAGILRRRHGLGAPDAEGPWDLVLFLLLRIAA